MSEPIHTAMLTLRSFLFASVYRGRDLREENKVDGLLRALYDYFLTHIDYLPHYYAAHIEEDGRERAVCDYIAGMTDRFAVEKYRELFIPRSWNMK